MVVDLVVASECGFCIWIGKGKKVKIMVRLCVSLTVVGVDVFLVVVVKADKEDENLAELEGGNVCPKLK